jgi:hypothetical protein
LNASLTFGYSEGMRDWRGRDGVGGKVSIEARTPGKQTAVQRSADASAPAPGKRTRTEGLGAGPEHVHAAAAHGTSGAAGALPHLDLIQRSFGRHDVRGVQAHRGAEAEAGAAAMGAEAFASGGRVAFGREPDLHLAAHEAAHVVQQRGGVQLSGGVGAAGDAHEAHADRVADAVVAGQSAEPLLDAYAAPGAAAGGGAAIQRFAFIKGKQVTAKDPHATGAVEPLVKDDKVRDYESVSEMKLHAAGGTDYLGNLDDATGTWLRFSPTGTNVIGEDHTFVRLQDLLPKVNSKSFIYEPFAIDDMTGSPQMGKAYDKETADRFKVFGVESEPDKKQFGAESIHPKLGFNLALALPYLEGKQKLDDLKDGNYAGQPVARYLKIAWGFAKDVRDDVAKKLAAKQPVKPAAKRLNLVVQLVEPSVDKFITGLPLDGYLGDELAKGKNQALMPDLATLARAAIDALVEVAVDDPSSRMTPEQKGKFGGKTSDAEKQDMFVAWRDFKFEDTVKDAAQKGIRYAGMGYNHLKHLRAVGLPKFTHDFDMTDLGTFADHTKKLKATAKPQP